MQARLMFAAATAIKPDILIVDEVLGAGDAYFFAKSKSRVEKLVSSGCTMLLVSHSMQQVLEFCDEAIWMDQGQIRMRGESFLVVKAYESYSFGSSTDLRTKVIPVDTLVKLEPDSEQEKPLSKSNLYRNAAEFAIKTRKDYQLQEPIFVPHLHRQTFPDTSEIGLHFQASGGISRWDSQPGLKIIGFSVLTPQGLSNILVSLQPAKFVIYLKAEVNQKFNCSYGIAIHDHSGVCVARLFSPKDCFDAVVGDLRSVNVILNPCQIGPGEYIVGISVTEYSEIEKLNSAKRYDLLNRSFKIKVEVPDSLAAASAAFFHSSEWMFNLCQK
jgi:lipopolysaccharide transport system ATP-binding protein